MEKVFQVKYTPQGKKPWAIYILSEGTRILKTFCPSKAAADKWVTKEELKQAEPLGIHNKANENAACDCVAEASLESFPCSDPPAWTEVATTLRTAG